MNMQFSKMNNTNHLLSNGFYLTDGGLETELIFRNGIDLPHFASFDLFGKPEHIHLLDDYYLPYLDIAVKRNTGFILESATWRANEDWGFKMGYTRDDLEAVNQIAIGRLKKISSEYADRIPSILISGCIGPRGDGYMPSDLMSSTESEIYHSLQVKTFRDAGADMVCAHTMNYVEEALGIVNAARQLEMPVVISFTVETDGRLPSGIGLEEAIELVDKATDDYVAYFMINCAHPTHFTHLFEDAGDWKNRIMGVRANASCKSHQELDNSTELDPGDKALLAAGHVDLQRLLPNLRVFGGCCGTDVSHIEGICEACL